MRFWLYALFSVFIGGALAANITPMSQQALLDAQAKGTSLTLLDVRTPAEFAAGHVPGAINITHTQLEKRLDELAGKQDQPIVVYCRSGHRAGIALKILQRHNFTRLYHLQGDMNGWVKASRPIQK